MIRVKVELDPGGLGHNVQTLADVHICNDGRRTALDSSYGTYNCYSFRKGTSSVQRTGKVENHPRKSKHVLTLVRKALEQMGY